MYENPRTQEQLRHPSFTNPQMSSLGMRGAPSLEQQPSAGPAAQPSPQIGELAAQIADLEARLQAQETTQAQPTSPSPTAQQFTPTLQPSTGVGQQTGQQRQPQQPQQPQQGPVGSPQPQQNPAAIQQGSSPGSQLQRTPGRLRSLAGTPMVGPQRHPPQPNQPTPPGQGSPMQQPQLQQPSMQQGPQLSPFQIQQPGMGNQQPWMGPQTSPMQTQAGSPLSSVGPMGQMSQVSPLSQTGGQRRQPQGRRVQQPPVDILDEGDDIVLEIELPGTRKEDIHVTAQRNVIDLRAATPERREKENLIQSERSQTVYRRQIPLGVEIDSEEIDANFEEGVLRLRAPKRDPKSGPQRIEVN